MRKFLLLSFMLMFAFAFSDSWAQERTVSGKVSSIEDGSTLPGVNVVLKGTTTGTVTDIDGNFKLSVPSEGGSLVFSFIGLATEEVAIGARSVIDIQMSPDVKQLSEVVVTAFGLEREKKALGYAVQDVKGEDIAKAKETNIVNSLQGKVSGVQITNSNGGVGSSSRIVIRGNSSLTGNNQPLFVVDGIPIDNERRRSGNTSGTDFGNGAADINPDDVQSITVLKGPNAAALYGSRASNGVILITTKSGKNSKGVGVSVNSGITFESPMRLPDYQNQYGQGNNKQFSYLDGAGGGVNDGSDESWGPQLDVGLMIPQFFSNGQPAPWVSSPDNVKDFFEVGKTVNNNIAVTGGNDAANFRLSYTNMQQKGMIPNTDYERNTMAFNAGVKLTDKLSTKASVNYIKVDSDNRPQYGYDAQNVMQQFSWFGRQVDINKLKNYENADGSKNNWNYNYHNNPYFTLNENLNGQHKDRVIGNVSLNYQITDWLSVTGRTGVDWYSDRRDQRIAQGDIDNANGFYQEEVIFVSERNSDVLLSFNKALSEDFNLALSAGVNERYNTYQRNTGTAPELAIPGVYNLGNAGVTATTSNYFEEKKVNSALGTAQLAYKNYLFLDLTGRNDWSSTLPDGNNSYFYPSASLSAVITDMADIQSDILTYAKVRGSWAQVGSDTDPYRLQNVYDYGQPWGSNPEVATPNSLYNSELKPESTTSIEFGADLRFLNNRIGLDLTYYSASTTDQIINIDIPSGTGYLGKYVNAGELTNKGIEVLLRGTPIKSNDFSWDITLNWAKNKSEVVELTSGLETIVLGGTWDATVEARVGSAYGAIFGHGFARDPEGNIIHRNGRPTTDPNIKELGNTTPDWVGGMVNSISYKGINLGFTIDGRSGGDVYSVTHTWANYAGVAEETVAFREGGIVGAGVKNVGTSDAPVYVPNDIVVSAESYIKGSINNNIAEGSVFDGSFIKLRELRLGYTLPDKVFGNMPFRSVNISIVGRNLGLLYSKIPHIDPETSFTNGNAQGLEFGQLPTARSLGFTLSFKL